MSADEEELSENTPPEVFIQTLQSMGLPEGLLAQLRSFAERGIHPAKVLQAMQQRSQPEEEPRPRMVESFDLEGIARYIAEKECRRIVVMCGAGISTSAGIPDFRTPGTGLYDNLQRFDLPQPEAIFDIGFFRRKPGAFYELAKEMWPGNFSPTPTHYFIKLLEAKGLLQRCYTQNIDSLECLAGLPKDKLVAAHGNFDAAHVLKKNYEDDNEVEVEVPIEELKAAVEKGEEGWQALRAEKGDLVKPKIVFFGEPLPDRFVELHAQDLSQCDLLLVLGTSLVVHPFAGLVGKASRSAPRLLINREAAGTCDKLSMGFRFHLDANDGKNWRDVHHAGDCDSGCRALAEVLGWTADLDALIDSKGEAAVERAPWAGIA